jgi:hypothetical protein
MISLWTFSSIYKSSIESLKNKAINKKAKVTQPLKKVLNNPNESKYQRNLSHKCNRQGKGDGGNYFMQKRCK